MTKSICIIDGHPDPEPHHLIHALCAAYAEGAASAGHKVERIDVARLDFSMMLTTAEFETPPPEPILSEREKIARADHLLIGFPLWLGNMPARLKAFFEQAARGNYFLAQSDKGWPAQMMKGKSARVVVSMGMPGLVYRFGMDEGALKALERGLLGISGFHPLHHTIIGGAGDLDEENFKSWQTYFYKIGVEGV
ncbi:MAG: NAD(P)H-dependent oxidoreductase [Hyphomonas sp.]|nr:NAD(P)H-dependent oxidoreductase [Hyphomonas sp.]HRX73493.1 NAD(P)H-dependent oxidoreductase [Hyphomonas sp.]